MLETVHSKPNAEPLYPESTGSKDKTSTGPTAFQMRTYSSRGGMSPNVEPVAAAEDSENETLSKYELWQAEKEHERYQRQVDCPDQITEVIRHVIEFDGINAAQIASGAGIPKATLSRFLNRQGNLHSETLSTLAEYLGLSLVRHVNLTDHVNCVMHKDGHNFWWEECNRNDEWDDERYCSEESRQEWEQVFRVTLAERERKRLGAIQWIALDDADGHRTDQ